MPAPLTSCASVDFIDLLQAHCLLLGLELKITAWVPIAHVNGLH